MTFSLAEAGPGGTDRATERDAISIESQVFFEAFGNTRTELDAVYEPYRDQTIFVVAYDSQPVGMMRLFLPGEVLQLSLKHAAEAPYHAHIDDELREVGVSPESVIDLAATAVVPGWRGRGVFQAMAARLAASAGQRSLTYCCAIVEQNVLAYLEREGLSCRPLAAAGPYMGSCSVPVLFSTASMATL
jgi:GNAT superfamily N-acetyltransferase